MPLSIEQLKMNLQNQLASYGFDSYDVVGRRWATAYHDYAIPGITGGMARGSHVSFRGFIENEIRLSYGAWNIFPERLAKGISQYWLTSTWPPSNQLYNMGTTVSAPPEPLAAELRRIFISNTNSTFSRDAALQEIAQVLHTYTITLVKAAFVSNLGTGTSVETLL